MRWCRFRCEERAAYGMIEGDTVIEIVGSPFEGYTRTSATHPLRAVKLLVPVVPPTFYAAGINFRQRVTEIARAHGEESIIIPRDASDAMADAIFGVRHYISRMSQYLMLYPGDVLWMGTDGASENLKDGDVVEIAIHDVGVLRNPVVREP